MPKSSKVILPAGSAKPVPDPTKVRFPLLVSYHYLRKWPAEKRDEALNNPDIEWMLDSGAFSAKSVGAEILLDEYLQFLSEYGHKFKGGYVALDKLGDPEQTQKNLEVMHKQGYDPMPVHVWGDDEKRMDELFEMSSKICLGGFKRPGRGPAPIEYVLQKMRWAKGRDVHWLGFTNKRYITALRPHSCDSSSHMSSQQYGGAAIYHGRGRWSTIDKNADPSHINNSKVLDLLDAIGYTIDQYKDPEQWRGGRGVGTMFSCRSWVRYCLELRERFGVRYYLAHTVPPHYTNLAEAVRAEKEARDV